jgi:predicted nucleic acid-binding protein
LNSEKSDAFVDPNFIYYMIERGESFDRVLSALKDKYRLFTDVKALQEIVYRYQLLGDVGAGYERATALRKIAEVFPVGEAELGRLQELMGDYPRHLPRELLHVAVMLNQGIQNIVCAPDSDYHEVEEIRALRPVAEICPRY